MREGSSLGSPYLKEIDEALTKMRQAAGGPDKPYRAPTTGRSFGSIVRRFVIRTGLVVVALLLPFFLLVRGSIFFYLERGFNTWLALGIGALLTALLLLLYVYVVRYRLLGKKDLSRSMIRGVLILVGIYCLYGVLYVSASNTKSDEVLSTYHSLHPLMRVALSSVVLVDRDLIMTDAARTREDYARMGLPVNERSLHFEQDDGYVHAVDLRTRGRSQSANLVIEWGFRLSGFNTLRHVGTADHLHVSLAVPSR